VKSDTISELEHQAAMRAMLRQATAADAPRVAGLLIDTRAAFMPYAQSARRDDELRAWVTGCLIPAGGVVVAEIQGSVVAAMHTERKEAISWITQMAVDPAFVGKGIGSLLLAHAVRTMPRPIRLYMFQANQGARRFYERHGFIPIGFTDGQTNEERCPDVLYELSAAARCP
jgi:GNAT superfamily N-acetyltransferase